MAIVWNLQKVHRELDDDQYRSGSRAERRNGTPAWQAATPSPYGDRSSVTSYLNPNAFVQPDLGTIGNIRPANVEGPGTWQFDLALLRVFKIQETQRMEFRGEVFNVTNSLIKNKSNLES